jgi:hypothetical protein
VSRSRACTPTPAEAQAPMKNETMLRGTALNVRTATSP